MEGLEVGEDSMYELPEPLGKSDLMAIATTVNRPDLLRLPVWKPDVATGAGGSGSRHFCDHPARGCAGASSVRVI